MIVTFILGLLAALGAPYAEDRVRDLLRQIMLDDTDVGAVELRLYSFGLLLLGAALVGSAIGSAHALPLALGAVVGIFGPRVLEKRRASRYPDYDS